MYERELLRRSDGPVTRDRIRDDLAGLGLAPGDTVMFHTRLSAIGYVPGGPQTVIDALLDVVGSTGTLLVTCGWNDAPPYGFTGWPRAWQEAVRAHHPAFDPGTSEAEHANGRLPEALRRRPGAVRSRHPDVSLAALGASAAALMEAHPWDDPHGPGSPLARLVARGGRVLLLGAPPGVDDAAAPCRGAGTGPRQTVRDVRTAHRGGGRAGLAHLPRHRLRERRVRLLLGRARGAGPFAAIVGSMLAAGIGREGFVGAAGSHLFDAGPAVEFGVRWIEEHLNGPPERAS